MALKPTDRRHRRQIEAGTQGRNKGHSYEDILASEINQIQLPLRNFTAGQSCIFVGHAGHNLVNFVLHTEKILSVQSIVAHSTGGLATNELGLKEMIVAEKTVRKTKSDLILVINTRKGTCIKGVSVKHCSNKNPTNDQLYFTTATAFCGLLRRNSIPVNKDGLEALQMFCGDEGFRPLDIDPNVSDRIVDPRRYFWEELPKKGKAALEAIFTDHQSVITRLLLQTAYNNDPFIPEYLIHHTKYSATINDCETALFKIEDLISASCFYGGFSLKKYSVKKGSYKDPAGVFHQAPRFGIIQMQRGGQAQHPTQLQFNLQAGYFYKLSSTLCSQ